MVAERDDEMSIDFDQPEIPRVLLGDEDRKKKKTKAKSRKKSDDDAPARPARKSSQSAAGDLPLSMRNGTAEDASLFDTRCAAIRHDFGRALEYTMTSEFDVGDIIRHKTFGIGFVVADVTATKMEVVYKGGRKLMVRGGLRSKRS